MNTCAAEIFSARDECSFRACGHAVQRRPSGAGRAPQSQIARALGIDLVLKPYRAGRFYSGAQPKIQSFAVEPEILILSQSH